MGFIFADGLIPGTWWTQYPNNEPVLVAWIGGPKADAQRFDDPTNLLADSLSSLERVFGLTEKSLASELVSWHLHDWCRDPHSRGAYSYVPVGAMNCSKEMTNPVEDTLFFAGEHTDTSGHWGTVHGALRSGLRASQQVLDADRWKTRRQQQTGELESPPSSADSPALTASTRLVERPSWHASKAPGETRCSSAPSSKP